MINRNRSMLSLLRNASQQWTRRNGNFFYSTTAPGLERVCIVGSGPAGFYTAKYLLKEHPDVKIDMLDALPTPFGNSHLIYRLVL